MMKKMGLKLAAAAALFGSFVGTPAAWADVTASLGEKHQKELAVFMMRAMGTNLGVDDIKNQVSPEELETMVSTGLNLNGHLCANITDIRPLKLAGAYEVTCVAYRGGSSQKTYIVDALNGTASEQ